MKKENVMVSACWLGLNCKYNGGNNYKEDLEKILEDKNVIPICPEIYGGLPTPRIPSEIKDNKVINKEGTDVTSFFKKGAEETLKFAKKFNVTKAYLKQKSPSCGKGLIYDGSFTGNKIDGNGITTELLIENGIEVIPID